MDELIAFVKARLDEDEAAANEVHVSSWCQSVDRDGGWDASWCSCGYPDRVLREVEAKRAILDRLTEARERVIEYGRAGDDAECRRWETAAFNLMYAVTSFAAAWSEHPDYRPEWKP